MVSHCGFAFIFLMTSEVGHFSHVFISIHILFLTKCLSKSFAHFNVFICLAEFQSYSKLL